MNSLKFLFILVSALVMQFAMAQQPTITKKYSNKEIEQKISLFNSGYEKKSESTSVLSKQFNKHFPNAKEVEWKFSNFIYKVEFDLNNNDFEAYYDEEGNLLMITEEIEVKNFDKNIKKTIELQFPKCKIDDIEKISVGTDIFYNVELKQNKPVKKEFNVKLNAKGEVVQPI